MLTQKLINEKGNVALFQDMLNHDVLDTFDISIKLTVYEYDKLKICPDELRFLYEILKEYYKEGNI